MLLDGVKSVKISNESSYDVEGVVRMFDEENEDECGEEWYCLEYFSVKWERGEGGGWVLGESSECSLNEETKRVVEGVKKSEMGDELVERMIEGVDLTIVVEDEKSGNKYEVGEWCVLRVKEWRREREEMVEKMRMVVDLVSEVV